MAITLFQRNIGVMCSLYLYYLGLSLGPTSKALVILEKRKKAMYLYGIGNPTIHLLENMYMYYGIMDRIIR